MKRPSPGRVRDVMNGEARSIRGEGGEARRAGLRHQTRCSPQRPAAADKREVGERLRMTMPSWYYLRASRAAAIENWRPWNDSCWRCCCQ